MSKLIKKIKNKLIKKKSKLTKKKGEWYVAVILPKSEKRILNFIETNEVCNKLGIKAWYPMMEVIKLKKGKRVVVKEPLYPNYMLFFLPKGDKKYYKMFINGRMVIQFIKDSHTKDLIQLTNEELRHIENLTGQKCVRSYKHLISKKVIVVKGNFKGMIGDCKRLILGTNKALVEIDLFGYKTKEFEINLDYLEEYEK